MSLEKLVIKHNRFIAFDPDEIVALDFNESMREIKILFRGGGGLTIEGKKARRIWQKLAGQVPELLDQEVEAVDTEDFS